MICLLHADLDVAFSPCQKFILVVTIIAVLSEHLKWAITSAQYEVLTGHPICDSFTKNQEELSSRREKSPTSPIENARCRAPGAFQVVHKIGWEVKIGKI